MQQLGRASGFRWLNNGRTYSVNKARLIRSGIDLSGKERSEMNSALTVRTRPRAMRIAARSAGCAFREGVVRNPFSFESQIESKTFRKGTVL